MMANRPEVEDAFSHAVALPERQRTPAVLRAAGLAALYQFRGAFDGLGASVAAAGWRTEADHGCTSGAPGRWRVATFVDDLRGGLDHLTSDH
jgi:hypothetical protein